MSKKIKPKKPVEILEEACRHAVEDFQPEDDRTFCNFAVAHIARRMGCENFHVGSKWKPYLLANEMVDMMSTNPDFAEVHAETAKKLADDGNLVIAGRRGDEHGHVAVVFPGREMVTSQKWGIDVPVVANVGASNAIIGANYAFKWIPKYWVWIRPPEKHDKKNTRQNRPPGRNPKDGPKDGPAEKAA